MTNIIKIIRYRITWSKNITKKFNSKWRVSWVVLKIVTLEETDIPEKSVTQSLVQGPLYDEFVPFSSPIQHDIVQEKYSEISQDIIKEYLKNSKKRNWLLLEEFANNRMTKCHYTLF